MRQPRDRVTLAAAGRVLDEIMLTRPMLTRVRDQSPHAIELVITREDEALLLPFAPAAVLLFLLKLMNESADQIQHAVRLPNLVPKISRRIAFARRRIARAAVVAFVEGQE